MKVELAKKLLRVLKERGIIAVVAGGYVRDIVMGNEPKDMDVVVLGDHIKEHADIDSILEILDDAKVEVYEGLLQGYTSYPVNRIEYLVKGEYEGIKVDIIYYKEPFNSVEEVVTSFDFNVNQGYITLNKIYYPDVENLIIRNFHHITPERLTRFFLMVKEHRAKMKAEREERQCPKQCQPSLPNFL